MNLLDIILLGTAGAIILLFLYFIYLVYFAKTHRSRHVCIMMSNLGDEMQVRNVRAPRWDEVEAIGHVPTWWAKIDPKHEVSIAIAPGSAVMALTSRN